MDAEMLNVKPNPSGEDDFFETPVEVAEEYPTEDTAALSEEKTPESEPESEPEEEEEAKEPRKDRVQQRFDQMTRERHELSRKNEDLLRVVEKLADRREETPKEPPVQEMFPDLPKPNEDDHEDFAKYAEAIGRWAAQNEIRKSDISRQQQEIIRQEQITIQQVDEWVDKGAEKFKDFKTVAMKAYEEGGPFITTLMATAVKDEANGHDIAYYLGKNLQEATKISKLSPMAQIREIGKLSYKLENQAPPRRATTKAPAPTSPVEGKGGMSAGKLDNMSMDEYIAHRNAREFGKK